MPTQQHPSTRFGTLDVDDADVIDFPSGLIGLPGRLWTLVPAGPGSPFQWLHSLEEAGLALPVTSPWPFFADYEVQLSDDDTARVGGEDASDVAVLVTVRAAAELGDFSVNLRAPILIRQGRGHQLINEAPDAPVRAPLGLERLAERAA